MSEKYRILIADDHSVVRQGVTILLTEVYSNLSISHASSFSQLLDRLEGEEVNLIILDISIPEGKGVQMIPAIREKLNDVSILIFSAYDEEQYGLRYMIAGANGYVNKLSSDEEFKAAVRAMIEKREHFSESTYESYRENEQKKFAGNPLLQLSGREMEIAKLLVGGDGNLEIANKLNLQNSTVSTYKNRIFEKLGINSIVALFEIFGQYSDEYRM